MKRILKISLIAAAIAFTGNFAKAQAKIGYINFDQLLEQMPETKTVRTQIEAYQKQFVDQLTQMNNEFQGKGRDYEKNRASLSDAARTARESELSDMQKRMSDYQNNAQQQVSAKTNELSKPLIEKLRGAIAQVAKEKGYGYVINSAQTNLVVSPPGDDLMNGVKAKLGVK